MFLTGFLKYPSPSQASAVVSEMLKPTLNLPLLTPMMLAVVVLGSVEPVISGYAFLTSSSIAVPMSCHVPPATMVPHWISYRAANALPLKNRAVTRIGTVLFQKRFLMIHSLLRLAEALDEILKPH